MLIVEASPSLQSNSMASTDSTDVPLHGGFTRFELELEVRTISPPCVTARMMFHAQPSLTLSQFVQCLANPVYLNYLAAQKYFDKPEFVAYLGYLQYFKEPKYTKFLQ